MALFQIDQQQFQQLDTQIGGLNGAVNKLAEAIAPADSSAHAAITELSDNLGKWQAQQLQAIKDGFVLLANVFSNPQTPEDQAKLDALTSQLKSSTDALDGAVKANQPTSS